MKYEDMSDFEVNKKVAGIFLPCDYLFDEESKRVELANYQDVMIGDVHDQVLTPYQEFNPCNNPSDAWPIMIDNNIFITATREDHEFKYMTKCLINGSAGLGWTARFTEYSDNPLRAAMICFLKMKDAENE